MARSALEGRRLYLDGASFVTTLTIAGTALGAGSTAAVDSTQEAPTEAPEGSEGLELEGLEEGETLTGSTVD